MAQIDGVTFTGYLTAIGGGLGLASGAMAAPIDFRDIVTGSVVPPITYDLTPDPSPGLESTVAFGGEQLDGLGSTTTFINRFGQIRQFSSGRVSIEGRSLGAVQFRNIVYGGLLPLDALITSADVTGVFGSTNQTSVSSFGTRIGAPLGLDDNDPFEIRGLLPFSHESSGAVFLGFLDLTLDGTVGFSGDNFETGEPLFSLRVETLSVNGGQVVSAYGGDVNSLSIQRPVAPIPLPMALPLLAAGIGSLAALRRRRRRHLDA